MKVLLVIPSVIKRGIEQDVANDKHPKMDYCALADALQARGASVDMIDYAHVAGGRLPADVALAWEAYKMRGGFDAIFTNGENVSIPLAMMLACAVRRPAHVTIGHRLTPSKKRPFFTMAKVHHRIDKIFVYATTQYEYALKSLRIEPERLSLIAFNADENFYRPVTETPVEDGLVSSAGLEWRDYDTLIAAAEKLPQMTFKLAAASPWSKHTNKTENKTLPPNVSARRYHYNELRDLYARSEIVCVPLLENDFQAGITTMLEAMAMGKPLIVTRTSGQTDVISDGLTGMYVNVGDAEALREALISLHADAPSRRRLGEAAREWLNKNASLTLWSTVIADAIIDAANTR